MSNTRVLLVNFGGPRTLEEIPAFLTTLLCDKDVVRSRFPAPIHNWFFSRIARKRALKIQHDYEQIGGFSPIYFDTETIAAKFNMLTFHRYLPATHASSFEKIQSAKELIVLPLFPQFSYATTGSIARILSPFASNLRWIKSYASHPAFIEAYRRRIADFLALNNLAESDTLLLFSAHGLPRSFIDTGDPYQIECQSSFNLLQSHFPKALCRLAYQSKFGKGEWLRPYTNEFCDDITAQIQGRKNVVFVPLSFTSDHIETLFEIEKLYLQTVKNKGLNAYRCPALNLEPYWLEALSSILSNSTLHNTQSLIYNN